MTAVWILVCALSIMAVICAAEYGVHWLNEYLVDRQGKQRERAIREINKHLM